MEILYLEFFQNKKDCVLESRIQSETQNEVTVKTILKVNRKKKNSKLIAASLYSYSIF
jgi:hypothetical protein